MIDFNRSMISVATPSHCNVMLVFIILSASSSVSLGKHHNFLNLRINILSFLLYQCLIVIIVVIIIHCQLLKGYLIVFVVAILIYLILK